MFKVLVIAYYFPPMGLSGVQRTLKFTKYLKDNNWEPTVITTGRTAYYAYDMSLMREAEEAGIKIVRTEGGDINSKLGKKGTVEMPREFLRKILSSISKTIFIPDNKVGWSKRAYKKAKEILSKENFDMIFVSIPPFSSFISAAKLKKEFDLPLFVDYRDLWFGNQFSFSPTPYHKMKHKKLEYSCLKEADKVIVTNRKVKEKIIQQYQFLTFEDVIILPQGFDPEDFEKAVPLPKTNKKMRITYSGIFYETITPKYFLKAFKKITLERPDIAANIELHFVGHFRKENKKLVNKLALQEFVFEHKYLEHDEAVKRIVSSDVLWMMIGHSLNADTIPTGKLFEYFGSRKPVLACVPDGAAKTAVEDYGAGFIAPPDDVEAIKKQIIKIHDLYKKDLFPQPNEEFVQKHNRKLLAELLAKQFQFYLKEDVV